MLHGIIGNGLVGGGKVLRFETDSGVSLDPVFTTGGSATFEWISPDGSISTGATPNPALNQTGVYAVKCSDWSDVTRLTCDNDNIITLSNLHILSSSLNRLTCNNNSISVLDVSTLTSLTNLNCYINSISVLDVSTLTLLMVLNCRTNSISVLEVAALTVLTNLNCRNNSITTLDVAVLTSLTTLSCQNNNMDETNVDKILADLVIASAINGTLDISGTNAAPSAAGDASAAILVGRGWAVTTS